MFFSEYNETFGNGTMRIDDMFMNSKGNPIGRFSVKGAIKTLDNGLWKNSLIDVESNVD